MFKKPKPLTPANLKTYDLPGSRDKLGVEAACDARAYTLFQSALTACHGDLDMAARLLQAAGTLALVGRSQEDLLRHVEEGAVQAAQAHLLTRAGVTAQEFAEDPQTAADKLADMVLGTLAEASGGQTVKAGAN